MFSDKVIKIDNIDKSGSDVYNRYDYQIACIFATFLTLYKETENFYILLDYLDDYVIVEYDEDNNELISFVQVKTHKGSSITMHTVYKNEWLLKQAKNHISFIDENVKNILKTNLGIKIKGKLVDSETPVSIDGYPDDKDLNLIKSQITNQTGITNFSNYYIVRSTLSLDDYENQLIGMMTKYINDNKYSELTEESIESIYRKIWFDLTEKHKNIVDDEEKMSLDVVFEKKRIKYDRFKDVFKVMLDIQLPKPGVLSSYLRENVLYLGDFDKNAIVPLFKDFRMDCARSGMNILNEAWNFLRDNKNCINYTSPFTISKDIFDLLDKNEIISTTDFYSKYKICMSLLFTYKVAEF